MVMFKTMPASPPPPTFVPSCATHIHIYIKACRISILLVSLVRVELFKSVSNRTRRSLRIGAHQIEIKGEIRGSSRQIVR